MVNTLLVLRTYNLFNFSRFEQFRKETRILSDAGGRGTFFQRSSSLRSKLFENALVAGALGDGPPVRVRSTHPQSKKKHLNRLQRLIGSGYCYGFFFSKFSAGKKITVD